jgi:hypothetical protein
MQQHSPIEQRQEHLSLTDNFNLTQDNPRWSWNPDKDRNNHRLSEAQCSSAFPLLYKEIDRAASYWKARGGQVKILQENIDLDWSWDA